MSALWDKDEHLGALHYRAEPMASAGVRCGMATPDI